MVGMPQDHPQLRLVYDADSPAERERARMVALRQIEHAVAYGAASVVALQIRCDTEAAMSAHWGLGEQTVETLLIC